MITPYGGFLCELLAQEGRTAELKIESLSYDSIDLSSRQICDLELLLNGGISPLKGFMTQEDYESVLDQNRLKNGTAWPLPIVLDISEETALTIQIGMQLVLRDEEGCALAVLSLESLWAIDKKKEAMQLYGTLEQSHPGVKALYQNTGSHYIGGKIEGLQLPARYDYQWLRLGPAELRARFNQRGWRRVLAFQTDTPMHCAEQETTLQALKSLRANLLLQPAIALNPSGDKSYHSLMRCYLEIEKKYPPNRMMFSILPLVQKHAGLRETLLQAIIRRNYGCAYLMISSDLETDLEQFEDYAQEIGVNILPFQEMSYVEDKAQYIAREQIEQGARIRQISEDELRRRLSEGLEVPTWFSHPEVIQEMRRSHRAKDQQGITVFFTGLSGSGKSTIANVLLVKLLEMGGRPVTLLDGDIVRKHLSSELGFSKAHRDINVRRIGFVASEITKNGGIAICAPIAPYESTRAFNRELISLRGKYVEVHVSTPISVCEERDRKGLYAKVRAGLIKGFTGIDDPYENPKNPELSIDTSDMSPEEAAQEILLYLENSGYIK